MINKVAITSANLIDAKDFKHFAPNSGAVYADKEKFSFNDDKIELKTLVAPSGDAHVYQPSPTEAKNIVLIRMNGKMCLT